MRIATAAVLFGLMGCSSEDEPSSRPAEPTSARREAMASTSPTPSSSPDVAGPPGSTRWSKVSEVDQIYPTSFTRAASGEGLVVGLHRSGDWVARIDREGGVTWLQRLTNQSIGGAAFTSDGGVLVAGIPQRTTEVGAPPGLHPMTIVLTKLDAEGTVRSTKGYTGAGVTSELELTTIGVDRFLLVGGFGEDLGLDRVLPGSGRGRAYDGDHRNLFFAEVNAAGEVTSSREQKAEAQPRAIASQHGVTAITGTFLDAITWPPSAPLAADPASNIEWPSGFLALLDVDGGAYWSRAGVFSGLTFSDDDVVTCVGTAGAMPLGGRRPSQRLLAVRADGEVRFETELPIQSSCGSIARVSKATYVTGRAATETEKDLRLVKVDASGLVVGTRKFPELQGGGPPPLLAWDGRTLVAVGVGVETPTCASPLVVMSIEL